MNLSDAIAASIKNIGPDETAKIMGSALSYMSQSLTDNLTMDFENAIVSIQQKELLIEPIDNKTMKSNTLPTAST